MKLTKLSDFVAEMVKTSYFLAMKCRFVAERNFLSWFQEVGWTLWKKNCVGEAEKIKKSKIRNMPGIGKKGGVFAFQHVLGLETSRKNRFKLGQLKKLVKNGQSQKSVKIGWSRVLSTFGLCLGRGKRRNITSGSSCWSFWPVARSVTTIWLG